ncbi:hypothetical protein [Leptospira ellisii]|nr:hypothetical protein [Leptospira ellisii]
MPKEVSILEDENEGAELRNGIFSIPIDLLSKREISSEPFLETDRKSKSA